MNKNGLVVVSLFDGMSNGQIALKELGVKVSKYFASEVDKFAMQQTQLNFPDTIQIGDVADIKYIDGVLYSSGVEIYRGKIDLLIGGSPCQNLSFAGSKDGLSTVSGIHITTLNKYMELKNEGFKFKGQSYLFWEYVRLLREISPKNFLLENVKMQKKWVDVFNSAIGVQPVMINSALLSPQNRERWYWVRDRGKISQPNDRGLVIKDILDLDGDFSFFSTDRVVSMDYSNAFTKTDSIRVVGKTDEKFEQEGRIHSIYGKSPAMLANSPTNKCKILVNRKGDVRKITSNEVRKLQTVPDWYVWKCSDHQKCKMLGNGWTVEVIKHIFKCILI